MHSQVCLVLIPELDPQQVETELKPSLPQSEQMCVCMCVYMFPTIA